MMTTCACTIGRLLSDEESLRIRQLLKDNGDAGAISSILGRIESSKTEGKCPHRHQIGNDTGYCSSESFLLGWLAELGEKAAFKNGSPL